MPDTPAAPRRPFAAHRFAPTPEQRAVLDTKARATVISALAGTGKTSTLCLKACALLAADAADERPILVLAYSRAGVTAVRSRMLQLRGSLPANVHILTLEQLCEQVLREQGDPVPRLDDPVRRRFMVLQARQALMQSLAEGSDGEPDLGPDDSQGDGSVAGGLAEWLAQPLDLDAFYAFEALAKKTLLDQQRRDAEQSARAFCEEHDLSYGLYRLYAQYEHMRVGWDAEPGFYADGDCTFELCRQVAALDWGQPLPGLSARYSAVLFDELHDLDEGALRVLRTLVQGNNGPFVGAGDFNQHIHEGAFSVFGGNMQHIRNSLPADLQVLPLHTTRRFGAEICAALNPLFDVAFTPVAGSSDAFMHLPYGSDTECAQQLVELHAQILNGWGAQQGDKGQHSTLNVVLRHPHDSLLLEWTFGHEGVHYACQGMAPFYLRREVALTLVLMWGLLGDAQPELLTPGIVAAALEGLLHFGRRASGGESVDADVLAQGRFDDHAWPTHAGAEETRQLAATLHASVRRLQHYVQHGSLSPQAPPLNDASALTQLLPRSALDDAGAFCALAQVQRIFTDAPLHERERRACLDSLDRLGQIGQGLPAAELLGRITLLAQASIRMHRAQEPVSLRLLSVDACKGREFTFVAVPFVERGRFPAAAAHHEAYRERNMLYVATTRARSALWLLESQERPVLPGPL